MINSVNTLDIIKPKIMSVDKFNSASGRLHHHTPQHTQNPTRAYLTFVANSTAIDAMKPTTLGGMQKQSQERVKVQHLENHTKLQNNNCWNNFRTLYNLSSPSSSSTTPLEGSKDMQQEGKELGFDADDVQEHTIDIQNKSAFNIEFNKHNIYSNSIYNNNIISNTKYDDDKSSLTDATEANNNYNHFYAKLQQNVHINSEVPHNKTMMIISPPTPRRTVDQEHAYRRIECVHNYAKLKTYEDEDHDQSPFGSRHSSFLEDEEDDDGEDDDDDEDDTANYEYGGEEYEMINLDADYEDIFKRRRFPKLSTSSEGAVVGKDFRKSHNFAVRSQKVQSVPNEDDIDVETVDHPNNATNAIEMNNNGGLIGGGGESHMSKPDHHARRPMNAFLIFCKRHRAIVKDRYKTLENRAITKILGDWWASLDTNDKKCFTNLAQQNKDAFFSANPNFKWYKLPAPPLRTLNTRPTNGGSTGGENYDTNSINADVESISNNTRSNTNYFKLADEAQMGDLSQLMQDKSNTKQCALQEALGETSQFMSAHLNESMDAVDSAGPKQLKRHLYSENSFSSNSSEEDGLVPKKKNARTCKGKIYQELINSGQITAPAVKKSKSIQRFVDETNSSHSLDVLTKHKLGHNEDQSNVNNIMRGDIGQKRFRSESDGLFSYDMAGFDLEEKIKELPALCLDDYLQRKRNTKKKKKFSNGKKRGGSRNGNNNSNGIQSSNTIIGKTSLNISSSTDKASAVDTCMLQRKQQQAVGSQKRKARKESITRRDVTAIEQEVASLLPLTINGCCYFQEAPLPPSPAVDNNSYKHFAVGKDTNSVEYFKQISPIIPLIKTSTVMSPPSSSVSILPSSPRQSMSATAEILNKTSNDNISSTSDLLILAEVATNRTELNH